MYTVPSNSRAIVKSILVAEDAAGSATVKVTLVNASSTIFVIDSSTTKIDTRARGRYAALKIENTGAAESWRFGTFQADLQPDGRR